MASTLSVKNLSPLSINSLWGKLAPAEQTHLVDAIGAHRARWFQELTDGTRKERWISHLQEGLPRSLYLHTSGKISILFNRKKSGDKIFDSRVVVKALDYDTGNALVVKRVKHQREVRCLEKLRGQGPFCELMDTCSHTKKSGQIAEYVFLKAYRETLSDVIERGGLTLAEKRQITKELLVGLEIIHRGGDAHRDIKLNNILIDEHRHIYYADFDQMGPISTFEGIESWGTPLFHSPELATLGLEALHLSTEEERQVRFHAGATQANDVWALGLVIRAIWGACWLPWDHFEILQSLWRHVSVLKEHTHWLIEPPAGHSIERLIWEMTRPQSEQRFSVTAAREFFEAIPEKTLPNPTYFFLEPPRAF